MTDDANRRDGSSRREGSSGPDGDTEGTSLDRTDAPLAVVVEKPRAEAAIESLRAEGIYDDSRRVRGVSGAKPSDTRTGSNATREREDATAARASGDREDGPGRVALPVTEPPAETRVVEVVRQMDPDRRVPDLTELLAERGWTESDLEAVPGSWAVIGSVILVSVPEGCPDEEALGEALLSIQGGADSVLADCGIATGGEAGTYREPRTRLLAGEADTETIHTEHGTEYALDPARVMFSPGNKAERARMGDLVEGESGATGRPGGSTGGAERVFDMFAGIGYFTLPMARAGADVVATEINPTAFRYLLENAVLNGVDDRIDAYRADCREVASEVEADRVVMGYYGSPGEREETHEFLPAALEAVIAGGVVHYHEATPETELWERPVARLETAVDRAGRGMDVLDRRRIKSHSPGVAHVVVDARIE